MLSSQKPPSSDDIIAMHAEDDMSAAAIAAQFNLPLAHVQAVLDSDEARELIPMLRELKAERAERSAAEKRRLAFVRTVELAEDRTNETLALKACLAILSGRPLPDSVLSRVSKPAAPKSRRKSRIAAPTTAPGPSAPTPIPADPALPAPNPPQPAADSHPSAPDTTRPLAPDSAPPHAKPESPVLREPTASSPDDTLLPAAKRIVPVTHRRRQGLLPRASPAESHTRAAKRRTRAFDAAHHAHHPRRSSPIRARDAPRLLRAT